MSITNLVVLNVLSYTQQQSKTLLLLLLLLLFYLYSTGAIDTLSFLIKRGAVINVIDRIGVTPLHLAARNG